MKMPFTQDQFFDVLAAYNTTLWPFVVALWIMTAAAVVRLVRAPQSAARLMTILLVVQWAWAAVAYHAAFFSSINPAAWLFAVLFLIQAGLLAWYGPIRGQLQWSSPHRSAWQALAWGLIVYGLLYPVFAWAEGHTFPRLPTFGVPCPTTILTIGLLLAADPPMPRLLAPIPIVWAGLGGQAAFLFGVRTDLALLASGIILIAYTLGRSSRPSEGVIARVSALDATSAFKSRQGEATFLAAYDAALKLWPVAHEETDVPTRFGSTHVVVSGPRGGPPLVLLHGYMATSTMWSPNIAAFSRDYRVFAVDVMGQPGKSRPAEPICDVADFVTWLTATLDALHLDRVLLVGMSFGGWVALNYAVAAPQRVRKLVLLSPGGLLPMVRQFMWRGMLMVWLTTRLTVNSFFHWLGFTDRAYEGVLDMMYLGLKHFRMPIQTARIMPAIVSDAALRSMTMPTLLLIGAQEVISDPARALERARRLIPDFEGELVPDCRHDMCASRHEIVDARVLQFLRRSHAAYMPRDGHVRGPVLVPDSPVDEPVGRLSI